MKPEQIFSPIGKKEKILVFMKPHYTDIEAFLRANFDCTIFKGDWGDPFPDIAFNDEGLMFPQKYNDGHLTWNDWGEPTKYDWIFSWLCPWKLPDWILKHAEKGAINFHPGPPKYSGIGCYNYAIWNEDKDYGVTAHLMDEKVDNGKIIDVLRFRLIGNETIETLKNRAIVKLKELFYNIMNEILRYNQESFIPLISEKWGEYKSKRDFEAFCRLNKFDTALYFDHLELKLRATYYPGANEGPFIEIKGKKWRLIPK
jgi:methionyl-tRNA formyltransferase